MNLYLISRRDKEDYDEFVRAVVAAPNDHAAKQVIPISEGNDKPSARTALYWTPGNLIAQCIGTAHTRYTKPTIILADYWPG